MSNIKKNINIYEGYKITNCGKKPSKDNKTKVEDVECMSLQTFLQNLDLDSDWELLEYRGCGDITK